MEAAKPEPGLTILSSATAIARTKYQVSLSLSLAQIMTMPTEKVLEDWNPLRCALLLVSK